jgi:transglutaminase-like putative cysteine protease
LSTPTLQRSGRPDARPASQARWNPAPPKPRTEPARHPEVPIRVIAGLATFCTSLCLGNLFDGVNWWLWPCTGAIVVAGLVGELGRRMRLPAVAMPLFYLVVGWVYVISVAARGSADQPGAGLNPSHATFEALQALVQSATHDIRSLVVPVPDRPGFLLLTVTGVFVVAALVDFVAVWLAAPAVAGIPLLALLAVPAALVTRGVGLLAFVASCAMYLVLLFVSGRRDLARWARLPAGGAPRFRRATAASGRRIGAVALVGALVIPILIPRYSGFAHHHGGGGGSATVVEPVVTLSQQLHDADETPLITVQTANPEYLRLTALEHFDGETFTLGKLSEGRDARVSEGLPKVDASSSIQVKQTITVDPKLRQRYLPLAYEPTGIKVDGDWRLSKQTYTVFSAKTDTGGATYTVTSEVPTPTIAELRKESAGQVPSSIAPDLALPSDLPGVVAQLTDRLTAGLTTEYDKAVAIQAYFRGPDYTYDLAGAPTGPDALLQFLTTDKRGYCQQFAGAMVVLARQAGIPARVAIGFTPGEQQQDGNWVITNQDAHAWPELWFPQAGWVRFEPTPRNSSTLPPAYTTPPVDPGVTPTPSASASANANPTPTAGPSSSTAGKSAAPAAATGSAGGGGGSSLGVALAAVFGSLAAVGLLLIPAVVRRRRRSRRLAAAAKGDSDAAWQEIVDTALDLGLTLSASLTPQRALERIRRGPATGTPLIPEVSYQVFADVARAEQLSRYSPGGGPALPDLASRMTTALGAWQRWQSWPVRASALLAPRSLRAGFRGSGGSFSSDDSVEASPAH